MKGDYYAELGNFISGIYGTTAHLNNITLSDVVFGTLFCIDNMYTRDGWIANKLIYVTITNILVGGNNGTVSDNGQFLYLYSPHIRLTLENVILSNFRFEEDAVGFNLNIVDYAFYCDGCRFNLSQILISNVTFSNLTSIAKSNRGLFYINGHYTILIDSCVFESIHNFSSIIHFTDESKCDIIIKNSTFKNNNGMCDNHDNQTKCVLIHCESRSKCNITIKRSTFENNVNGRYKSM